MFQTNQNTVLLIECDFSNWTTQHFFCGNWIAAKKNACISTSINSTLLTHGARAAAWRNVWWMVSVVWWYHSRRSEKFLLGPEIAGKCNGNAGNLFWLSSELASNNIIFNGFLVARNSTCPCSIGGWKRSSKQQHSTGFIGQFGCYVSSKYWSDHHWGCFIRHFLLVTAVVLQICCYEIFPNWFVWRIG